MKLDGELISAARMMRQNAELLASLMATRLKKNLVNVPVVMHRTAAAQDPSIQQHKNKPQQPAKQTVQESERRQREEGEKGGEEKEKGERDKEEKEREAEEEGDKKDGSVVEEGDKEEGGKSHETVLIFV